MVADDLGRFWVLATAAVALTWAMVLAPPFARSASKGSALLPIAALYVVGVGRALTVLVDPSFEHGLADVSSAWHDRISQLVYLASWALGAFALLGALAGSGGRARPWVVGFIGYCLLGIVLRVVDSSVLELRSFALPGVAFAITRGRHMPVSVVIAHLRWITRFLTVGTVLLFIGARHSAYMPIQERRIFGYEQVAGLTAHPNALGGVAALAIVLEVASRGSRLRHVWLAAAGACLLLAQSRGAWLAVLAALLVLLSSRLGPRRTIVGAGTLVALVVVFVLPESAWADLNGRGSVWRVALSIFFQNPVLGGGPNALLSEVEAGNLGTFASQAHNQLLEALAKQGLIGAALVVTFFVSSIRSARINAQHGSSAALMAVVAFGVVGLVETVFSLSIFALGTLALLTANHDGLLPPIEEPGMAVSRSA